MKKNFINKIIAFCIIFLFIFISINFISAKPTNINDSFLDEILFRIKVRMHMRFINMPSLTVCVIQNNTTVWSDSFGNSHVYLRKKANLDTIYVIGSISKTITATAMMQLIENESYGIDLDDNVSKYLPFDLKNPNYPDINITFRMLLAHQSSLDDPVLSLRYYLPLTDNITEWVEDRVIGDSKKYWGNYMPGERVNYSNTGFIITSLIVEKISGLSFEEYCQRNIFEPLQMYSTSFDLEKLNKRRMARPNFNIFGEINLPFFHYDAKCATACGGLRTTVTDLSHFLIAHMNNGVWNDVRILKNSTVELMHTIQYNDSYSPFYGGDIKHGLGWIHLNFSGDKWEGYNGGAFGYSCNMMVYKKNNTGVIMLSNGHFKRPLGKISQIIMGIRLDYLYRLAHLFIKKAN